MAKYRKKPVIIDAVQWFPGVTGTTVEHNGTDEKGKIPTLEGHMEVTPGDFIITGVKGEMYPCKPEIFHMTYDGPIEEE